MNADNNPADLLCCDSDRRWINFCPGIDLCRPADQRRDRRLDGDVPLRQGFGFPAALPSRRR